MANPHDFHNPKPSYTKDDLILSSEGGYFGAGNAQLPAPPMLMMDRIIELTLDGGEFGKGRAVAELDITPDLWFFACHFRGDPVRPELTNGPILSHSRTKHELRPRAISPLTQI